MHCHLGMISYLCTRFSKIASDGAKFDEDNIAEW